MAGKHLCVLVHFVWSTSNREPYISPEWSDNLYGYIGGILKNKKGKLICAGGIPDHIHILASLPSTISIADAVSVMKSNSSRWVHETIPRMNYFKWQEGYGAFSVSKSAEQGVADYIRDQEKHHQVKNFKREFLGLLKKHEIEYDPRYLWD